MGCKKRKVPMGFGKRLNIAITNSGMTLTTIEKMCGVHHSNICDYVQETMLPSAYNLYALCQTLKVSSDWLLGLDKTDGTL